MSVNFFRGNQTVDIALTDELGLAILVKCTVANIPSAVAGYAVGCELIATDTGAHYFNSGTAASCSFAISSSGESHIVKYAGKAAWAGSGLSSTTTIAGVATADVVIASISTGPTQPAYLVSAAPTTNTLTFTLSTANTSNDAVIAYEVLRAV